MGSTPPPASPSASLTAAALLAKHLDENLDAVVNEGVRRTRELPSYAAVQPEQLRPGVTAGFQAVLHDLSHASAHIPETRFGKVFGAISERRARQRFEIRDVCSVIQLTEQIMDELATRHIADLALRLDAVRSVHKVCIAARDAIIDSFWKVNQELLTRSEALVRQLSSPLLPIADGVIVLPLLGEVDAARARQMLECLLAGIVSHRAAVAIIDVTAITDVNEFAVEQLVKAARTSRLLGAEVVLVGMSAEVVRTVSEQHSDLSRLVGKRNLQEGLAYARTRSKSRPRSP